MPTDTTEPELTIVFAGPGLSTAENTKVNLDRWMPDHVAAVVLPTKIPRTHKGLKTAANWLTAENNFGPEGVDTIDDLADFLQNPPKDLADTKFILVVLWGDEGDPETEALIRLATDLFIPVKDLTAGMDDVVFEDKPPAEPEPEATPRRTRRTRGASAEAVKPDDVVGGVTVTEVTTSPGPEKPARKRRGAPRASNVTGPVVAPDTEETPPWEPGGVQAIVERATKAGVEAARAAKPELYAAAGQIPSTMEALVAELEVFIDARVSELFISFGRSLVSNGPGRPRKDGSPAQPRTEPEKVALLFHDDGTYTRRGRGRPDPSTEVVYVNPDQVTELLESPGLR
jgi:hypothetical protein